MKSKMILGCLAVIGYSAASMISAQAATGTVAIGDMTLVQESGSIKTLHQEARGGHGGGGHHFGGHHFGGHHYGGHHGGVKASSGQQKLPAPKVSIDG
jgi:hypothetical protein